MISTLSKINANIAVQRSKRALSNKSNKLTNINVIMLRIIVIKRKILVENVPCYTMNAYKVVMKIPDVIINSNAS